MSDKPFICCRVGIPGFWGLPQEASGDQLDRLVHRGAECERSWRRHGAELRGGRVIPRSAAVAVLILSLVVYVHFPVKVPPVAVFTVLFAAPRLRDARPGGAGRGGAHGGPRVSWRWQTKAHLKSEARLHGGRAHGDCRVG